MLAAKVPSAQSTTSTESSTSKINLEQKENTANESIVERKRTPMELVKEMSETTGSASAAPKPVKTSASSTATAAPVASPTIPAISARRLHDAMRKSGHFKGCSHSGCEDCDEGHGKKDDSLKVPTFPSLADTSLTSVRTASCCPISPSEMVSLEDILEFIEGNNANKKDSQKKAAKKAKQKQKKEDEKKVGELEQLRDEFHELYFKEFDSKNELKTLKGAKKRDKKKLAEIENSVKKFGKIKSKLESSILELIFSLKKNNSDFKFAYLPTKEQQMKKQAESAAAQSALARAQKTPAVQQQLPQQQQQHQSSQQQSVPVRGSAAAMTGASAQQNCEVSLDPSKRMVTIRRVNLPNSEAQVTITAKGTSPDKDKLLYTFINGQFVSGKYCTFSVCVICFSNTFQSL